MSVAIETLFTTALGLRAPWEVEKLELNTANVKGKRRDKTDKYREETSPENTSIWHGMDPPNGARTRVVDGQVGKGKSGASGKW